MEWNLRRINDKFYYQSEKADCIVAEIRKRDCSTFWIEECGNIPDYVLKRFFSLMKKQYNLTYYLLKK